MSTALDRFFKLEREKYGKANYYFKGDKFSSKLIGFYVRPFNPSYVGCYSTMRYPNTFFAESLRDDPNDCLEIELHENVHKFDRWLQGFWFNLGYAFPQWVAVPFIIAAVAIAGLWGLAGLGALLVLGHIGLAAAAINDSKGTRAAAIGFIVLGFLALLVGVVLGAKWWAFLLVGAGLFLSPWPFKARWRRDIEIRGYSMSLYREYLIRGGVTVGMLERYTKNFTGPTYFFMEPNGEFVMRELDYQVGRFQNNEEGFLSEWKWARDKDDSNGHHNLAEPFRVARNFLEREGLLHGQG